MACLDWSGDRSEHARPDPPRAPRTDRSRPAGGRVGRHRGRRVRVRSAQVRQLRLGLGSPTPAPLDRVRPAARPGRVQPVHLLATADGRPAGPAPGQAAVRYQTTITVTYTVPAGGVLAVVLLTATGSSESPCPPSRRPPSRPRRLDRRARVGSARRLGRPPTRWQQHWSIGKRCCARFLQHRPHIRLP
jgi:hypothetical protein